MTKKKPLWGAFVNLNGLYSQQPIKGYWCKDHGCWWSSDEELDFKHTGIEMRGVVTVFASYKKEDVKNFIAGAKAIQKVLKNLLPIK